MSILFTTLSAFGLFSRKEALISNWWP